MPVLTKADWLAWNEERKYFAERDSEGFTKDIAALKAHIQKLQEVCPKDGAGWPVMTALKTLDILQKEYAKYSRYLEQLR